MTLSPWDIRWKLAACLVTGCLLVMIERVPIAAAAFLLTLAAAALCRIRWTKLSPRLGIILLGLAPLLILLPFVWPPGRDFAFSWLGVERAASIALRALSLGVLVQIVLDGAPLQRTLAAAWSLGVPGPLVQIVLLAQRYAGTFAAEFRRLRTAWQARGFHPGTNLHTYHTFGLGMGALLVRAGERGGWVAMAMQARGYDGRFHAGPSDPVGLTSVLASFALPATAAALLAWDRLA